MMEVTSTTPLVTLSSPTNMTLQETRLFPTNMIPVETRDSPTNMTAQETKPSLTRKMPTVGDGIGDPFQMSLKVLAILVEIHL